MTDYQDLLQTIKSLQHSKLSYIELLQEEVKRNQDVSSDPLMAHSAQTWYHHIPKISNSVLLGFVNIEVFYEKLCSQFRKRVRIERESNTIYINIHYWSKVVQNDYYFLKNSLMLTEAAFI